MNGISDWTRSIVESTFRAGGSIRSAMSRAGVAKQTAHEIYKQLGERPLCECGQPSDHRGWCSSRFQKSEKRQAVVGRFRRKSAEDTLQSNPIIDNTPKAPKVFMKDGAWIVPEDERPKGWEKMGLSEPLLKAHGLPNALREIPPVSQNQRLTVDLGSTSKEILEVQTAGHLSNEIINLQPNTGTEHAGAVVIPKLPPKWADTIEKVSALKGKETVQIEVFPGISATQFKQQLRSMLAQAKATHLEKWSVTMGIDDRHVSVGKSGVWPSMMRDQQEQATVTVEAKERTEHTVTERSVTITQAVSAPVVEEPKEESLPAQCAEVRTISPPPLSAGDTSWPLAEIDGPPDAPELKEFTEKCVRAYSSDSDDDAEWSQLIERDIPDLATRIKAYRDAIPTTNEVLSKWARQDQCFVTEDVSIDGLRELWVVMQAVIRDKRLLELKLIEIANRHCREMHDWEMEGIGTLLPDMDKVKLREAGAK